MSQRVLAEVVSQYLDLGAGRDEEYLSVLASRRHELEPLLGTIRLLRAALVPVEPPPDFVATLRAHLGQVPAAELPATGSYVSRVVLGAVAVGSLASAAAICLILARARATRAA